MTTAHPRVLVAHRDGASARAIGLALTAEGHETLFTHTVSDLQRLLASTPDLLILGELADTPIAPLVRDLRADGLGLDTARLAIVCLVAPEDDLAEPRLLRAGADDVCSLPPVMDRLLARVEALLRRTRVLRAASRLRVGALEVDAGCREALVRGVPVPLAKREFDLLRHLAVDPQRVFTKAELLRDVWGYDHQPHTRTVDTHAYRLRRKLTKAGLPNQVIAVWGVGYRLVDGEHHGIGEIAA